MSSTRFYPVLFRRSVQPRILWIILDLFAISRGSVAAFKNKLVKLETARDKARKEMDLDTLTRIEIGKFKTRRQRKTKRIWPKPKY